MPPQIISSKNASELRQDLVSGDWVAIATARAKRPNAFIEKKKRKFLQSKSACPFEHLEKSYPVGSTYSSSRKSYTQNRKR